MKRADTNNYIQCNIMLSLTVEFKLKCPILQGFLKQYQHTLLSYIFVYSRQDIGDAYDYFSKEMTL